MKKGFTLYLILSVSLLIIISSCGSQSGSEEVKKEVDCECNKLFDNRGIELKNQDDYSYQVFTNSKADSVFTGTCAILSKDRSKDTISLHSFEKGYRSKTSKFEIIDGEKIQKSEYTYNDKDEFSGWDIALETNLKRSFTYVVRYREYKNKEIVYSYKVDHFYNIDRIEGQFKGTYVWERNGKLDEKWKRRDDCYINTKDQLRYVAESNKASVKSFFQCLDKMKLKKWWYKIE